MRRAAIILGILVTSAMLIDAAISATSQPAPTTSTLFQIVKLRGQVAAQQVEIVRLSAELALLSKKLETAEQWNVRFLLWLNPGGTYPRKPPREAMDYCMAYSGPGVKSPGECFFCDFDKDRDVDTDDLKLWEAAK